MGEDFRTLDMFEEFKTQTFAQMGTFNQPREIRNDKITLFAFPARCP